MKRARAAKQSLPPLLLAESKKPFYAKRQNVIGMPRMNIEEAFDDARQMGVGARVVDSQGIILARWVNTGAKWWKALPDDKHDL